MTRAEFLPRTRLAGRVRELRSTRPDARIVLANGCFDLFHIGHLRYLEGAKYEGDVLIVAVNSDASVRALKGSSRPTLALEDRVAVLCGLRAVDFVTVFEEPTLDATLRMLRPDVHAKGSDYTPDTVPERDLDARLGIEIAICGGPKIASSSELIERFAPDQT